MSFHYKNAVVVGYFLVNWALIVNLLDRDKFGVICAVLSMASCYFLETMSVNGISKEWQWLTANTLAALMIAFVVLSYIAWLI